MTLYVPIDAILLKKLNKHGLEDREVVDICSIIYRQYCASAKNGRVLSADGVTIDFHALFMQTADKHPHFRISVETYIKKRLRQLHHTLRHRLYHASGRHYLNKHDGKPEITLVSFYRLFINQSGKCYYNRRLSMGFAKEDFKNHIITTERLDQSIGYTLSNTVFICMQYQTAKQYSHALLKQLFMGYSIPQEQNFMDTNEGNQAFEAVIQNSKPRNLLKRIIWKNKRYKLWTEALQKNAEFRSIVNENVFFEDKTETDIDDQNASSDDENSFDSAEKDPIVMQEDDFDEEIETADLHENIDRKVAKFCDSSGNLIESDEKVIKWFQKAFLPKLFLTSQDVRTMYNKQQGRCFYSNYPLSAQLKTPFTLSIERIDNFQDYTVENCVLVCQCMQASRVKWTSQLFIADHQYWRDNLDEFDSITTKAEKDRIDWLADGYINAYNCDIYFCDWSRKQETWIPDFTTVMPHDFRFDRKKQLLIAENKGNEEILCQLEKKTFCSLCEKNFTVKTLTQHKMRLHSNTLFMCPHANCRTIRENQMYEKKEGTNSGQPHVYLAKRLISHYMHYHTGKTQQLECITCGKLCYRSKMDKHLREEHTEAEHHVAMVKLYMENNITPYFCSYVRTSKSRKEGRKKQKRDANPEQWNVGN